MWQDLFATEIPTAEKIIRTVVVYLLVMIIFRIIGKRAISAMGTTDFVLLFLLSNVVQNAIIGADNSLVGGAIGAITLVLANAALDWLSLHSKVVERLLIGTRTVVIQDGRLDTVALRKIGMRRSQLSVLVHEQDGDSLSDVELAAMEPDGHLLVRVKRDEQSASRGDIAALSAKIDRIEALLKAQPLA